MTFILGVTGGIASGKSTVSSFFTDQGVPVIDADVVARDVVKPGTKGLDKIVGTFGKSMLHGDGTLNRKKLGELIFQDETKRDTLNTLIHSEIEREMARQLTLLKEQKHNLIVLDIPLLYEGGYDTWTDEVMVVYVSYENQLQRLMKRNHLLLEEAEQRIHSQMPLDEKKEQADAVIDNNGDTQDTLQQVASWLTRHKKNCQS